LLYAKNDKGIRILPKPQSKAFCPLCNGDVISKCGAIVTWHWAHTALSDCDAWYEPESEWHKQWKYKYPEECQEVTIGRHRADIVTENREVIELQNSSISPDDIAEREKFYGNMVWIFNATENKNNVKLTPRVGDGGGIFYSFRWMHPKKHIAFTTKPTFLDLGQKMLLIKKMGKNSPCYGWGYLFDSKDFTKIKRFNGIKKIEKSKGKPESKVI
jgi:competence protein CoiA